ncbi:hypothetical protein J6590_079331 [Homalodisca vitripennis]|nr:hypothetical protein J6590_079331 [Homalodisca vitripennis]
MLYCLLCRKCGMTFKETKRFAKPLRSFFLLSRFFFSLLSPSQHIQEAANLMIISAHKPFSIYFSSLPAISFFLADLLSASCLLAKKSQNLQTCKIISVPLLIQPPRTFFLLSRFFFSLLSPSQHIQEASNLMIISAHNPFSLYFSSLPALSIFLADLLSASCLPGKKSKKLQTLRLFLFLYLLIQPPRSFFLLSRFFFSLLSPSQHIQEASNLMIISAHNPFSLYFSSLPALSIFLADLLSASCLPGKKSKKLQTLRLFLFLYLLIQPPRSFFLLSRFFFSLLSPSQHIQEAANLMIISAHNPFSLYFSSLHTLFCLF